jgi:tetratricopeptide (TPR) repeat protein
MNDRALHDGYEQERLAIGLQLWQLHGWCNDLIESACGLAESAHLRGDKKAVTELGAQVAGILRELREQQGIGESVASNLAPALARVAPVWRDAGATSVQAEVERMLADFGTNCQDLGRLWSTAVAIRAAGEFALAEPLLRRAGELAASCKDFTELQNAAVAIRDAGELDLAEPLLRKAVELAASKFGDDSTETASACSALGRLLALRSAKSEASLMYRKALEIRERHLGPDDKATRLVVQRIAELDART